MSTDWQPTACMICSMNCGIEVETAGGDPVDVMTSRGRARTLIELHAGCRPGHISLPNGQGSDVRQADGSIKSLGVALNNLTDYRWRDPVVGTSSHKYVPACLERVA